MTLALGRHAAMWIETPCRYALGDPANPLLTLNAVDSAGVMWVCEEPVGWDAPSAATPIDQKQYGHGGFAGETFFDSRVLTFTGSALAPDPVTALAARDRLLAAIYSNLNGDLQYTHLDEAPPKTLLVRPGTGLPRIAIQDQVWLDYSFLLVAPDPLKRSAAQTYGPIRLASSSGAGPGRGYPRTYPLHFGAIGSTPANAGVVVGNPGNVDADAIYVIQGPIPTPQVRLANGQFIAFGLTLAATDTLTINTAAGTAIVNGANRLDALLTGSTFPLIPANGGVEVRLSSLGGGTSQAASLYVTTAPTWQ